MKYGWPIAAILLMSGCSSLSKQECLTADWRVIGFEDGSGGKPMQTIGAHRKACAKVGVSPDMAEYEAGHRKGLSSYCTVSSGFSLGMSGASYSDICQSVDDEQFRIGWEAGNERKEALTAVQSVQNEIDDMTGRLSAIDEEISAYEESLVNDRTASSDQRREWLEAVKNLKSKQDELQQRLVREENVLRRAQISYDRLLQVQKRAGFD